MMEKEQFQLWQIEEVQKLSEELSVVRNVVTGALMLKRVSAAQSYELMCVLCETTHPNLMRIYDTALIGDRCVSLCEYIDGSTLEEIVSSRGPYAEKDAKTVVSYICSGLSALHQRGLVHRDINPSNVMLTRQGFVKIIDYDIARAVKAGQKKDTVILGTVGYASPEQFGFRQTDASADIFSCGVLLNYLLTGALPSEKLYDGALRPVIEKCIEIDADKRYESAEELRAVLTGDRRYLRKHKYDDIEQLRFRPIPGFRSKHVFPKILTVFGIIVWVLSLLLYILILASPSVSSYSYPQGYYLTHVMIIVTVYGFWSLFPYLLFGDVGKYTRLFTDEIGSRRVLKKVFGWISIILGFVMIFLLFYLYSNQIMMP